LETHILFVDYVKAFDRVHRRKLWEIITNKGYPDHMIQKITHVYEGTVISTGKGINISSKMEIINQGVRQGCPL
jgi:hypothetical protein